ncbi:MAG TPA: DUF2231 domain-containing protein [Thermomicrobiales bacterium]|nr:DUF2231 domain-containing protein [Thermomicrobiales bacterium]
MESRAKLLGHPIHPMLIPFPLGLLGTAVLFDLIALIGGDWDSLARAAFYMIAAGIIGGLLAAVFGARDWLAIPGGTRAKGIATTHGLGNVIIVVLFIIAWLLRYDDPPSDASGLPIVLEVIGALGALGTGWLGGELVDRLGVGVDPGAHLDAPSSLSGRPASEDVADTRGTA